MYKSIFEVIKSLVYRKIYSPSVPEVRRDDDEEEEEVSNYYDAVPLLSSGSDNHQRCIDIHTVPVPVVVAGPGDDDDDRKWGEQIRHPAAPAPFPFLFPGSSDDINEIVVEVEDISKNILKEDYNSKATTTTSTDLLISRLFGDNRINYVNNGYQSWKPSFNNGHDLGGVVPTSTSTNSTSKPVVVCNTAAALDLDDRKEDQCSIIPIKNEKKKNKMKVKKSCNIIDSLLHPNSNPNPNLFGQTTRCGFDVSSVKAKDKQQHIQNINGGTTRKEGQCSIIPIKNEKKKSKTKVKKKKSYSIIDSHPNPNPLSQTTRRGFDVSSVKRKYKQQHIRNINGGTTRKEGQCSIIPIKNEKKKNKTKVKKKSCSIIDSILHPNPYPLGQTTLCGSDILFVKGKDKQQHIQNINRGTVRKKDQCFIIPIKIEKKKNKTKVMKRSCSIIDSPNPLGQTTRCGSDVLSVRGKDKQQNGNGGTTSKEGQCSIIPIKNEKKKNKTKVKKKKSCNIIDSLLHPNPNPLGQTTRCGSDVSYIRGKDKQQHIQNINEGTTRKEGQCSIFPIKNEKKKNKTKVMKKSCSIIDSPNPLCQTTRCGSDVSSVKGKDKQQHIQNINGGTTRKKDQCFIIPIKIEKKKNKMKVKKKKSCSIIDSPNPLGQTTQCGSDVSSVRGKDKQQNVNGGTTRKEGQCSNIPIKNEKKKNKTKVKNKKSCSIIDSLLHPNPNPLGQTTRCGSDVSYVQQHIQNINEGTTRKEGQCSIFPIKNEKKKNKTKVKKKKSCSIIDSLLHPNPNPLGQTTRCGYDVSSVSGKDEQQHIQNINGGTTSNVIIRGEKKKTTSPSLFLLHHHRYLGGQAQCGWSVNEEATTEQHHIHNVNTNGGQKNKKTAAAATNGIIKWVGLYNSSQRILAVGEGDFSFSASLATAFGSASKMIATSLDGEKFLLENYSRAELNLAELRKRGCVVKHKVNATTMARDKLLRSRKFDRIIYNFPHAGFTSKSEPNKVQISVHQALVRGFLANAKMMIEKDGQVHITHKCNDFHIDWNIVALACSEGLELLEEVPFDHRNYPGYCTKYGFGGDANFNCYPSKTYIFVLRD